MCGWCAPIRGSRLGVALFSDVFIEKLRHALGKEQAIVEFGKAVALIGEKHIRHGNLFLLHRLDDLIRLGLLDARIVGALTDEERARVEPFLPKPAATGRRRKVDLREVMNAIRYVARTGCGWRMLPKDFPPRSTAGLLLRRR